MDDPRATIERHYRTLGPKLMSYLLAGGMDDATAGDVVQETFLRLWGMRERLDDDDSRVSGLVFTIARNLRNDRSRKAGRETLQGEITDEDPAVPVAAPRQITDNAGDREYLRNRLRQALETLPPLLKEAFTLFQLGELPIAEIARRTDASESLVKVRIFRAKEKLRPLLKDLL